MGAKMFGTNENAIPHFRYFADTFAAIPVGRAFTNVIQAFFLYGINPLCGE
jgi:hypothetical protein